MSEKLEALKKEQTSLQKAGLLVVLIIGAAFLLTMISYVVGIAGFILAMIIYVAMLSKKKKEYKTHVKAAILEEGYRSHLRDPHYLPKEGISKEAIIDGGFLPVEREDKLLIKETVKGSYKNHPVTLAEVTTSFRSLKKDKKGGEKSFEDFLSGVYFEMELSGEELMEADRQLMVWQKDAYDIQTMQDSYQGWKLSDFLERKAEKTRPARGKAAETEASEEEAIPASAEELMAGVKKSFGKNQQEMQKARLGDTSIPAVRRLAGTHLLFQPDAAEPQVLQEHMADPKDPLRGLLNRFCSLAVYTPGQAAFQLTDHHLRVFVRTRFLYTIEVPVKTELTPKLLSYCDFPEISYLLRMADEII